MELLCNKLAEFLVDNLPDYLSEMADSTTPLPDLTTNTVKVGTIDIEANKYNQMCFIVPDVQNVNELTMAEEELSTKVDVFVFVRNNKPDVLFRQAMRYGAAIKKAVQNDYTINGNFTQAVVSDMEYFDMVEAVSNVKAIRLSVYVTQEMMEE